jgi:hypothetical protein
MNNKINKKIKLIWINKIIFIKIKFKIKIEIIK